MSQLASPNTGTQSADSELVCQEANSAVRRTAPLLAVVRKGAVQFGPLSKNSADLPHYTPKFDLSDVVPSWVGSGTYSEKAERRTPMRDGADSFLAAPSLIAGQRVPYWGSKA